MKECPLPDKVERLHELITDRIGLAIRPRRCDTLMRGLRAASAQSGCEDLEAYYHLLYENPTESKVWRTLICTLTVGETYFFRSPEQFAALRTKIIPDLIARHRDNRRLRIWSAGCSSGEEPYSLAILLHQMLPDLDSWNVFILATDINKEGLSKARQGHFREWSFRQLDPAVRRRYFTRHNAFFQLKPEIQEMVTFKYLNLTENCYPSPATFTDAMDLILCRNVAIYLPEKVTRKMAASFYNALMPGGWLMVGESETNVDIYGDFTVRNLQGASVYQKMISPTIVSVRQGTPPTKPAPAVSLEKLLQPNSRLPEISVKIEDASQKQAVNTSLFERGVTLSKQGRYVESIKALRAHVEGDPDFSPAYYQLGRAHANLGHPQRACTWLIDAIELDPLLVEAHYALAVVYQEMDAKEEAAQQFKRALYMEPDFALAHISFAHLIEKMGRQKDSDRHRSHALRLVGKMPPDETVPGSDGLTAGRLLTMIRTRP